MAKNTVLPAPKLEKPKEMPTAKKMQKASNVMAKVKLSKPKK